MHTRPLHEHGPRQRLRHIGIVELGEAEGRLAQLAVLLVRVREPFHQAFLVDEFDAAAAFAGVEERFGGRAFAAADAAVVRGGLGAGEGVPAGGGVHDVGCVGVGKSGVGEGEGVAGGWWIVGHCC